MLGTGRGREHPWLMADERLTAPLLSCSAGGQAGSLARSLPHTLTSSSSFSRCNSCFSSSATRITFSFSRSSSFSVNCRESRRLLLPGAQGAVLPGCRLCGRFGHSPHPQHNQKRGPLTPSRPTAGELLGICPPAPGTLLGEV